MTARSEIITGMQEAVNNCRVSLCIFFCVYSGKRQGKGEGLIFSFNSTQSTPNYFAAEHGFYTGGWKHNMRSDLHHLLMIFFQSLVDEG